MRVLKTFLQYAKEGTLDVAFPTGQEPESPFEESVLSAIRVAGYQAEPQVCRVEVKPSHQPVYARGKQSMDFYVRLNNGTRSLDIEEAVAYISAHDWAGG